jgi:beta-lactam-binding protein with PASTA domain
MPSNSPKAGFRIKLWTRSPTAPHGHPLRARVWTAGRLFVLFAALAATFGAFFLTSLQVATRAREVQVPDVRGRAVAEATAALAEVGLAIRIDPIRRADAQVPVDHVLSQDPEPGSVLRRQRGVRVRVSDGQRDPSVPAVVGQSELAADGVLQREGVNVDVRSEIRSLTYPAGTVVAQDPPANNRGPAVMLLVNRGEAAPTFVMPDVIGTVGARTAEVLRRRNFRVAITAEVQYPGIPPGVVVDQSPRAGFQVSPNDTIALQITR